MPIIEPFIRWAGGKSWFLPQFTELIHIIDFNHFHEPFLGGGAVFLGIDHKKRSYLSDINEELINTYIQIRDNPQNVAEMLFGYNNSEKDYYQIRNLVPQDLTERAARFIYLNQTSYNGIYRVNKEGKYNVPYGHRNNWHYSEKRIFLASERLKNTNIKCGDFEVNKYIIKRHDLIFLDPPYTVSHNNNGFIEYNKKLFSLEDQERLCRFIEFIKHKDAYYILTNAAHPKIKEIFGKEDRPIVYLRNSLIGGKNAERKKIEEYVFTNIRRR